MSSLRKPKKASMHSALYEYQNDNYDNNGHLPDDGVFRMKIDDFIAMYEHLYAAY